MAGTRYLRTLFYCSIGALLGLISPSLYYGLIPRCQQNTESTMQRRNIKDIAATSKNAALPKKKLLFAGVMTAEKFLDTRAKAVYETWGKIMPGKMMFFASSSSHRDDLPVVSLTGVDDSYPPQRKSMMMLKYMHDNFIDDFEWFLRADDDVYIRTDKMEQFLRQLNSSDDLYIGQAGVGIQKEKGKLGLGLGDNFCMGGPGVIISASTLRKVVPYLEHCLQNLYTTHEDVEVGRCIKKFVGISCTWAFEMQSLFYHNRTGAKAYTTNLDTKAVRNAVTLHPLKRPEFMYRLHTHFMELKIQQTSYDVVVHQRQLDIVEKLLTKDLDKQSDDKLARLKDRKMFNQKMLPKEVPDWEMFTPRKVYSYQTNAPEIGMLNPVKDGLNHVLGQTMSIINKEARKVLHRTLEFKRLNHGYKRYHPRYGMQYMLDLLMKYHRHVGYNRRRMTVHVRHHAYLQQPFTSLMYAEDEQTRVQEPINFLLPLAGRLVQFKRFMGNFERICLHQEEKASLTILYFPDEGHNSTEHKIIFESLKEKYTRANLKWINMEGRFSRALALTVGVAQFDKTSLLFFCDVDLEFDSAFMERCRSNTILDQQIYYPIVFSQFDPEMANYKQEKPESVFYYSKDTGFWRKYAFGITCQYRRDFDLIGGFDTTIQGWGMEDVDLYDRFVLSEKHNVFRAPDPGLVHIYHPVQCDEKIAEKQLKMCYASKAQTYGSQNKIYEVLYDRGYFNQTKSLADDELFFY
ncbi:chondroitin sulfate synthase 1-like [Clytia hemisphaerica]|uniref:Hexosyltransferase n=1 Tax=Clytia hemisphaerica TaxID=252671 RepID=A0A7M5UZW7_9CNID